MFCIVPLIFFYCHFFSSYKHLLFRFIDDLVPRQEKFPRLASDNFLNLTDCISPCKQREIPQVYLRNFRVAIKMK